MGDELFWLVRTASAIWIAWRATVLIGVNNPLMGIMFAIVMCVAAPFGLDMLLNGCEDSGDFGDVVSVLRTLQIGAPMAFALIGVFLWSCVETATGQ